MYQVQNITSDALQQQTLVLPDGTFLVITLNYKPLQYGWFANLTYGTFELDGLRITNSPNMLFQFRNLLPFGLACISTANREPTQQQDFLSGEAALYVLSKDEMAEYVQYLEGL